MIKVTPIIAIPVVGALLVLVGCGGGGSDFSTIAAPDGTIVVSTNDDDDLGEILVDAEGNTLYTSHKDFGGESTCYGTCAEVWVPVITVERPVPMGGAKAETLNTTTRRGGSVQVTYWAHPLYWYAGDEEPGDTNGNAVTSFGDEWYAMHPDGTEPPG